MFSIFKKKPSSVTDINWLGVDIHNHLLPGIDDGSKTVMESIEYISKMMNLGFEKLICTPHIFKELYPNTAETINPALQLVKDALSAAGLKIEISSAAEYMVDENFKISGDLLCLPSKNILIEMSYLNETPNIEKTIFDLQIKGYSVILAHPERYNFYHSDLRRLKRYKDMGVLLQLNLLSVAGYYGKEVKKAAEYIIESKLYDVAGTDLHHDRHLSALSSVVESGILYKKLGSYPFLNRQLFGVKS
ncbi:CpsB/CapC family capsule biosynthesis tyrosine phosphatase [Pedobacter sp. JY14-1]|uniref:tyrosine-protein phosphatase n=1 Tax=Pedobacter sp. JY14-1 TaxID=3034151 RepID=UPI0023E1FE29|nr:CpsB/CapC family capsule biosynthesis tyrosine phosphatase [Pedobacter sp. JY14-1]